MSVDRARTMLAQAPWLRGAPAELPPALAAHGRLARFAAGSWVHAEGDAETGLFLVVEGAVQLFCQAPGGREVLIGLAGEGATIGQAARMGGGPRMLTAICVEPSLLLLISDSALDRVGRTHPELWRAIASLLYTQLNALLRIVADNIALPPRQRLAARLMLLAQRGGRTEPVLKLSQSALAEMLGFTRKTVNAYLGRMAADGLVEVGYGRIVIKDLAGVQRVADG